MGRFFFLRCAGESGFAKYVLMKHEIPHDLDLTMARVVASRALDSYRARFADYQPRVEWVGDRDAKIEFQVKGFKLQGAVNLLPGAIQFDLDVPFVLKLFKGRAVDVIEREVRHWIAKAKAGELTVPPSSS